MDSSAAKKNTERLEETLDRLTDESQSYFLGVLEALNFAQNATETPVAEAEEAYQ